MAHCELTWSASREAVSWGDRCVLTSHAVKSAVQKLTADTAAIISELVPRDLDLTSISAREDLANMQDGWWAGREDPVAVDTDKAEVFMKKMFVLMQLLSIRPHRTALAAATLFRNVHVPELAGHRDPLLPRSLFFIDTRIGWAVTHPVPWINHFPSEVSITLAKYLVHVLPHLDCEITNPFIKAHLFRTGSQLWDDKKLRLVMREVTKEYTGVEVPSFVWQKFTDEQCRSNDKLKTISVPAPDFEPTAD